MRGGEITFHRRSAEFSVSNEETLYTMNIHTALLGVNEKPLIREGSVSRILSKLRTFR